MKDQIVHCRLINGDEIIAKMISETKTTINLENVYALQKEGTLLALFKYNPFIKTTLLTLQKTHVLTNVPVHDEVVRFYNNSRENLDLIEQEMLEGLKMANESFENSNETKKIKEELISKEKETKNIKSHLPDIEVGKVVKKKSPNKDGFFIPSNFKGKFN